MPGLTSPVRNGFLAAVKVFRDHVQVVGAIFNSCGSTLAAKISLKSIAPALFAFSLDLGSLGVNLADYFEAAFIVLLVAVAFALCGFRVFMRMKAPDVIREGHEVELWDKRKEKKKWTIGAVQLFFRLLATTYIELVRQIVMVLSCSDDFRDGLYDADNSTEKPRKDYHCGDSSEYDKYTYLAVAMMLIFGIGSPLAMAWAIRKNKPTGSPENPDKRYDHQGNLVDYTDEMYRRDLAREDQQACPYVFLYDDYKRTRSYYELEMMLFKSAVVICGVLLADHVIALGLINLGIVLLIGYISYRDPPFLDPMVSAACFAGHITEIIVQALLVLSAAIYKDDADSSAGSDVLGSVVFIAAAAGVVVNIFVALITNDKTRPYVNSFLGRLTFSSVVTTSVGTARVMLASWDPLEEARQRSWKSFWDSLVQDELGEVGVKRLREEDSLALKLGVQRLHESVVGSADAQVMAIRNTVLNVEGVDVYWRYNCNRACSYFGKMYVVPFPFHAVMVYDDTDEYIFIHDPNTLNAMATVNRTDQEVLVKKDAREKMRGMWGKRVRYTYDRWVTKTVEDGYSVYKDANGVEQRRTEYSTISVHIFYTSGIFQIGRKFASKWSYGFRPSVYLDDGQGSARKPRTGEMVYFSNETYTVGASELGIDHTMNPAKFAKLFDENRANLAGWQQEWLAEVVAYRKSLANDRYNKNCVLRDEFWYAIYNQPLSSAQQLRQRILQFEKNPKITAIAMEPTEKYDLERLCAEITRLEDPTEAFWFTFWHDVWLNNSDIKAIGVNPDLFNPEHRTSLAHRIMTKEALEAELTNCLGAKKAQKLFSSSLLDLLYEHMRAHGKDEDGGRRSSVANRGSYIPNVDDADTVPDVEQPTHGVDANVIEPVAAVGVRVSDPDSAEVETKQRDAQDEHEHKQIQDEADDKRLLSDAS